MNLRAGGLYRGTSRKGTTVFVSLQPGTQSWPQALAREVKLLLVPFKDPEKAAGAAGEPVTSCPMPHSPAKCCGLPFGEPSCCKVGSQGQPHAPAVRAAKLLEAASSLFGFRLSRSGVMLLHLSEQERIHQCEQSPHAAKPDLLPKRRRGEQIAQRESRASSKAHGNQW